MSNFRLNIIPVTLLLFLLGGSTRAQDISLDKEKSRLWIEGSTNVNQFSCMAASYDTMVSTPIAEDGDLDVEVDIEVKGFDCGRRRMNRDLYETLLSEEHPFISFEYTATESIFYDDSEGLYHIKVKGDLTVAGHKKEIEFPMKATLHDGSLRAIGQSEIRMTDYNVEPPTKLLGMVRVDDQLSVHFELYATTNNTASFFDGQNKE